MPIYEFVCPIHGRFEEILPLSYVHKEIQCGFRWISGTKIYCYEIAQKVVSIPATIQIAKPTRIFVNPRTGEARPAGSSIEKIPFGCVEKELKGPIERSRFEKEQQKVIDAKNEVTSFGRELMATESMNKRHDDLKATMNAKQIESYTDDNGNVHTQEFHLDHKEKALLKSAMNRSRKKPIKNQKKSEVMLTVNHTNSSNMIDNPSPKR